MIAAEGILTSRGGVSSHAALVARQMGKVCVCGASATRNRLPAANALREGVTLKEGDYISIDGTAGEVFAGEVDDRALARSCRCWSTRRSTPKKSAMYQQLRQADELGRRARTLGVRTNADTPEQVANAVAFGAEGIGLCRTEHMFFEGDRIDAMREMILADDEDERAQGACASCCRISAKISTASSGR